MDKTMQCKYLENGGQVYIKHTTVNECPLCHAKILPTALYGVIIPLKNETTIKANNIAYHYLVDIFNYCESCFHTFISSYAVNIIKQNSVPKTQNGEAIFLNSKPVDFIRKEFEAGLEELSPMFVEIYNQAHKSETIGLTHISGMGYRKALEFLIKDYSIKISPDNEDKISKESVSQCITNYIEYAKIKELATKSIWLANDETHYKRKHPDNDLTDLKRLIDAVVYYIYQELTIELANTIEKK